MKKLKFSSISILIISMFFLTIIGCAGGSDPAGAAPKTDTESVAQAAADLTADDIAFTGTETASTITSNFTLPLTGTEGTTIVWTSNNGAVVITGDSAAVTQPAGSNATVTLTAAITKGTITEAKTILITILKAATWTTVGTGGLSAASADRPKIAIDSAGTPYVLYIDRNSSSKATVMKYNGSAWETVGSAGFSAGGFNNSCIAFAPNGTLYIAYQDYESSYYIRVMKFDGSNWVTVGTAGFGTTFAYPKLAFDSSSTPYVSNCDNSSKAITVYKLNGTTWDTVGTTGAYGTPCLAIDSANVLYVAYIDNTSTKTTVIKYNGATWETVGTAEFTPAYSDMLNLIIDPSDTPYVLYKEYVAGATLDKPTVMKFSGGSWTAVGSGLDGQPSVSLGMGIAFHSGIPYVAFSNEGNVKAAVMKYTAGNWVNVGNTGFTPREFSDLGIAISPSGVPYVVFLDREHMSMDPMAPPPINKAMVMKLE